MYLGHAIKPELPLVSVIIPTRNNELTITECLLSIFSQTYWNTEILVIDAFSADKTREIAENLHAKVISIEGERTKAKNYGLQIAKGEFVLFVDSDMSLEQRVIQECVDLCKDDVAGVIIPERSVGKGFWVKVRDFERSLYAGSKIESARFFTQKYAKKVGGFDENIVFFEESTLHQKVEGMGLKVNARTRSCILHHEDNFNLRKWLDKKKYYADTVEEYSKNYPEFARLQISALYRISLFVTNGKWKRLMRHPILTIGLFILKTLELISSK